MTPWFDAECSATRRKSRAFERRYRKSKSADDRHLIWTTQVHHLHKLYEKKRNLYWEAKVKESHGNPKKLWKTLSSVLCRDQSKTPIPSHGDVNAENFSKKLSQLKSNLFVRRRHLPHVCRSKEFPVHPNLNRFQDITVDDAIKLLQQAANKNCKLDPVPTWIIKTFAVDLASFVALLINTSTRSGSFPSSQKRAIVTPILKKASLDAYDLSNY